ncbi:MAG: T9SS type A sorting domain-containing protein [Bacteroidota bacterium]
MKYLLFAISMFLGIFFASGQTILQSYDFTTASGWSGWRINNFYFSHYFTIPVHGDLASVNEGDHDSSFLQKRLVSPPIDLSIVSSAYLSVSVFFLEKTYNAHSESLQIQASINGGATWTPVKTIHAYYDFHTEYADLTPFCGNSNVLLSFLYSDNNGWLYGAAVDDVNIYSLPQRDAALVDVNEHEYWPASTSYPFHILFQNRGSANITSLQVEYSVDGGVAQTHTLNSISVAPLDTLSFTHSVPWIPSTGSHIVNFRIASVNGTIDQYTANDSLQFTLRNVISTTPEKRIVINWIKGTWCTLCGYSGMILDSLKENYPTRVLPVIMHDLGSYDNIFGEIYTGGMPAACMYANDPYYQSVINDAGWLSRGKVDNYDFDDIYAQCIEYNSVYQKAEERLNTFTPVNVTATAVIDTVNRTVVADLSAEFFANLQGDFRFNCVVLKDSVFYLQDNWFTNSMRWPYCPPSYYMLYHKEILIQSLGGKSGTHGSIPFNINDGSIYTWHYADTLKDQLRNADKLHLVFMVEEYDSISGNSVILNAGRWPSEPPVSTNEKIQKTNPIIYPNPSSDYITVDIQHTYDVNLRVFNTKGSLMVTQKINGKQNKIDIRKLPPGLYFLQVQDEKGIKVEKFVKE